MGMWLTRGQTFLNRAGLGLEVMHERNAHNFPLDLAAAESTPVALTAPLHRTLIFVRSSMFDLSIDDGAARIIRNALKEYKKNWSGGHPQEQIDIEF